MSVNIPFPIPNHGYALNSKLRINLDYIVAQFNAFNTGTATWDNVSIGVANSETGTLTFYNANNANYLSLHAGTTASSITYTLPITAPSTTYNFLLGKADGTMKWSSNLSWPDSAITGNQLLYIDGAGVIKEVAVGSGNKFLTNSTPPSFFDLLGTSNQIIVTPNVGNFTLSTPQDIGTSSNVIFNSVQTDGGTASNPGVRVIFSGASTNTGLFSSSGTSLSVTVAGTLRGTFDNTGDLTMVTSLHAPTIRATTQFQLSTSTSHILTMQMTTGGSADYTISWPNAQGASNTVLSNDGSGNLTWVTVSSAGGATKALDNLASVAINTALLPGSDNSIALGSSGKQWTHAYLSVDATISATSNQFVLGTTRTVTITAPTPASSSRIVTIPDLSADYSIVGTEGAQTINGNKTISGTTNLSGLTASLPLQLDSSKNIVSTAIDLSTSQVTGNLGTSHLNSGTGASSSTFWRGDGTWATPASTGTVNSGTAGRLGLYATSTTAISDTYVQNSHNITLAIAAQASRSADLALTIPNPGNAITAANVVLDQGAYTIAGAITFSAAVSISATSNHIVLSTSSNTLTVSAATQATSARTWTVPDISGNGTFAALEGTQTFSGAKTFSTVINISGQSADEVFNATVSDTADLHGTIKNSSNTSGAHSYLLLSNGGTSGGDPYVRLLSGTTNWSMGIDTSDSIAFVISNSSGLGTNNYFRALSNDIKLMTNGNTNLEIDSGNVVTIGKGSDNTYINLQSNTHATGSNTLTLTNAPTGVSGNPTGYLRININGSPRDIPFW